MPRFKSENERMKHKQARLISASMWNDCDLFASFLDDSVLALMKTGSENLTNLLTQLSPKLSNSWLKKQAWLAIALSHPTLNYATLENVANTLNLNNYDLFFLCSILENSSFLNEFLKKNSNESVHKMLSEKMFYIIRKTAEHGRVGTLKYFQEHFILPTNEILTATECYAYRLAALNGYLDVLIHLEKRAPELVHEMIKARKFDTYKAAAARGHFVILKHIESMAPQLISEMEQSERFYAFCQATQNGHLEISNWMIAKSNACFAYAEKHMREYGQQLIIPFIERQLVSLHYAALNNLPPNVFDVHDEEHAKRCFYIIRNLIRRNDSTLNDELLFLLNIPSVKALAHTEVTTGVPNELLRLALSTGNHDATAILLNVTEIKLLAEQNNFYQAEVNGQLDLGQLTRDRESSMTMLTCGEQRRLNGVIQCYYPKLKLSGVNTLMDTLRNQLKERYARSPATITLGSGKKITLPMDFTEFQQLGLNNEELAKAQQEYYKHKVHTAWRYISKPNPWMNPNASYVYVDKKNGARWSTFEEYQELICLFWLAAGDEAMVPTDGHTIETRLAHFIHELALIGRAHNWDNAGTQEYESDDLTGDKPSCFSGVKRRLFQSVLGHSLINILTEDILIQEIRDFTRGYVQRQITPQNKLLFKKALEDYLVNIDDLSNNSKQYLGRLNISTEEQCAFELYLSGKYGAQYSDDFNFHKLVRNKFQLDPKQSAYFNHFHALMLDGVAGIYQMLSDDGVTAEVLGKKGLFAVKETKRGGVVDVSVQRSSPQDGY